MEKLKVYENHLKGSCYCGGLLIVAAHNEEEAHEVCMKSKRLEGLYWDCYLDGTIGEAMMQSYPWDGFKLIPNLTYEGEPCVIAEDSYCE